jgi:hypothetical protein
MGMRTGEIATDSFMHCHRNRQTHEDAAGEAGRRGGGSGEVSFVHNSISTIVGSFANYVLNITVIAIFLSAGCAAQSQTNEAKRDDPLLQLGELLSPHVVQLLKDGRCKKVWLKYWPLLTKRDAGALHTFALLSNVFLFKLPGQEFDQISIMRRNLIFNVYGFDINDTPQREILLDYLDGLDPFFKTALLRVCFADAKNLTDIADCQSDAERAKLIPKYGDFLAELKQDSEASGRFVCEFAIGDFHKK